MKTQEGKGEVFELYTPCPFAGFEKRIMTCRICGKEVRLHIG